MSLRTAIQQYPTGSFFGVAFSVSWGSGLAVMVPKLLSDKALEPMDALLLFPVLVIGVGLAGILFTSMVGGRRGLRDLFSRMVRWRVRICWYAALLIPPSLITLILLSLRKALSQDFAPNFFPLGILFGLFPGLSEEIGWMGYAFPIMKANRGILRTSLLLGVLWALWHLPVANYLGAAAPHR